MKRIDFHWERRKDNLPGITIPSRKCSKCHKTKEQSKGKYFRGTSRHNPGYFICGECLELNNVS